MILIIIVILIIGVITFSEFGKQNTVVQIGNGEFTLPDGYMKGEINEFGALTLTNGTNSIYIVEKNDSDIPKYLKEYGEFIKDKNETMTFINLTIDNVDVYKTDNVDNPTTVHYWFNKNNKTYEIYSWDGNNKMDTLVVDMIKTLN